MTDAVFLNPPYFPRYSRSQRSPAVTKSGTLYYPMWLAYAAAWVEKHGFSISLIDAPAEGIDMGTVINRIKKMRPRLLVIDTSTPSIANDLKAGDELKKNLPESYVLMVGTHVSAMPWESLHMSGHVDAVAVGEYENAVLYTLQCLNNGKDPAETGIPGVWTRTDGETFSPAPSEPVKELDGIPFVSSIYKRFLNERDYFNPNALYPMITIVTGRGCRYRCSFCVYPQVFTGKGQRLRSMENILEEFRFIKTGFPGVKSIFLEDDTFTANVDRCREFCHALIDSGINISWTANARADVDKDTLLLLKAAGCRTLCVGFESGDQELLDTINKKITVSRMMQFTEDARDAGLLIHGCFLYGMPGETRKTMQKTLSLALSLRIDTAQFYPMMVYPGTTGYDWYKEHGLLAAVNYTDWLTSDGLHNCIVKTKELEPADIVNFCDYSRRKFYLRPSYILKKGAQVLFQPSEFRRKWKSALSLFPHLYRKS